MAVCFAVCTAFTAYRFGTSFETVLGAAFVLALHGYRNGLRQSQRLEAALFLLRQPAA